MTFNLFKLIFNFAHACTCVCVYVMCEYILIACHYMSACAPQRSEKVSELLEVYNYKLHYVLPNMELNTFPGFHDV